MKTPTIPFCSVRLPDFHTCGLEAAQEQALLELLSEFRQVCDGVWFASDFGFPTLATHQESAAKTAAMAAKLRAQGIACSLQISNTIGHGNSPHLSDAGIDWDGAMIGHDGANSHYCHCPSSPGFRDYLWTTTRAYAQFQPDFCWIDDDLRMRNHHPVRYGCFCALCLEWFATKVHAHWTREALVAALGAPHEGKLRETWIAFNQERLASVAGHIRDAVWSVSPETRMGLQQASPESSLYNGRDFRQVYNALSAGGERDAGCRAGGGYYTDFAPRTMLDKAFAVSRQFSCLPDYVTVRCPEIENFPHGAMGKTPTGTALEAAVDIAVGANCLSLANMMYMNEPAQWHSQTFQTLAKWQPYCQRLISASGQAVHAGMAAILPRGQAGRNLLPDEAWDAWTNASLHSAYQLAHIGLPVCTGTQAASGYILTAEAAKAISATELRDCAQAGLLMDGQAAAILQQRNLAALAGIGVRKLDAYNSPEYFTDDPLNGGGPPSAFLDNHMQVRTVTQYALEPCVEQVRVLGVTRPAGQAAAVLTLALELADGGRVGVIARNAWATAISSRRRRQILSLADWVSRQRLPVMIDTAVQVAPIVRSEPDGQVRTVTLLNEGFGDTPPIQLRIRLQTQQRGQFKWLRPMARTQRLAAVRQGDQWLVELPSLPRWSIGTLLCS